MSAAVPLKYRAARSVALEDGGEVARQVVRLFEAVLECLRLDTAGRKRGRSAASGCIKGWGYAASAGGSSSGRSQTTC